MSNYGGLERKLARLLNRFPAIKKLAKYTYSRLAYLRAKKPFKYKSINDLKVYKLNNFSSFFGYYEKSPKNNKEQVLALISSYSTDELPSSKKRIELIVFDNNEPILRIPIFSYNWQQGCRAHWLTDDLFIFNNYDPAKKNYIACVYSISKKTQIKEFEMPVQDSFSTEYFISLNYQRLMKLRPDYGYRNLPSITNNELNDFESDGLWRVNYETGETHLLISIATACKINPLQDFSQATHKFNHVMISPDGKRFIFMHRYFLGQRRFDRLLVADANTGEMKLLNDYGMVSHCFWLNNRKVLGYMRGPENKDGYWLLDIESGEYSPMLQDKLKSYGDGHPHVHGDWFITDTYPDKSRMQHLLLCNWKTGEVKELGEFFHGFNFSGETRCDLHPRFSPDGKAVFFDSVFTGQRQLYRLDLNN